MLQLPTSSHTGLPPKMVCITQPLPCHMSTKQAFRVLLEVTGQTEGILMLVAHGRSPDMMHSISNFPMVYPQLIPSGPRVADTREYRVLRAFRPEETPAIQGPFMSLNVVPFFNKPPAGHLFDSPLVPFHLRHVYGGSEAKRIFKVFLLLGEEYASVEFQYDQATYARSTAEQAMQTFLRQAARL